MKNIIENRYQHAKHAFLLQQRAGVLIDTIEQRDFHSVAGTVIGVRAFEVGTVSSNVGAFFDPTPITAGSACTVLLIEPDYPTGGPAMDGKTSAAIRGKPEWVSSYSNVWARWTETTKELLQRLGDDAQPIPSAAAKLRVERLARIQAALGVPTQALAEVLQVSRPGLYKWLDASKDITLQEASRQRLSLVERLAKLWRARSAAPVNSVAHEPLAGGRTLLELLTDETLNEVTILDAFDEAAAKLQGKPKSLSKRMTEAGFTRRPSRRSISDDE